MSEGECPTCTNDASERPQSCCTTPEWHGAAPIGEGDPASGREVHGCDDPICQAFGRGFNEGLKAVRFWKRRLGEREDDADNLAAALSASEARVRELEEGVVDPTIQRLRVSLVNVREEHDQLAAALRSLVEAWEQDFDGEDMAVAVAEARSVLDSLPASPTSEGEDG